MPWLKKRTSEPLTVSMTGIKLADRVLVVGCSDPDLIAALAIKAGLTGRACAVDADASRVARTAAAVEREGALVETSTSPLTRLPFDTASFDVVVVRDVLGAAPPGDRRGIAAEAERVLRGGGRCIVIETAARASLGGLMSRAVNRDFTSAGGAPPILTQVGFAAVRTLAERNGLTFAEGVKRNAFTDPVTSRT
jgi:ubiquinone/menaquinone biosynthesis C-methylase UbiE